MRYSEMWPKDAKRWDMMVINPSRVMEFQKTASHILQFKSVYRAIEEKTAHDGVGHEGEGVPWPFIAVAHLREAGEEDIGRWKCYLGNGQLLTKKTTIVPKNRGPFLGKDAFLNGALDGLAVDGLSAIVDWRLEKNIYWLQSFNGFGYEMYHNMPSPYVWGGTNIQKRGKYLTDGKFNASVMDTQPGIAPMLLTLMRLDPSITFARES